MKPDVAKLRQTILQLAIEGKLGTRDSSDEPASSIIAQIEYNRSKLIIQGAIKKTPNYSPVLKGEEPFDIPENWTWARLGNLFEITSSKRVMKSDWSDVGVPFFRARDLARAARMGEINSDLFISDAMYDDFKNKYGVPKENDLMVTGVGTIGIPYVVRNQDKFYFKDATILWLKNVFSLNANYIKLVYMSNYLKHQIARQSTGATVGTYTIKQANMNPIPLPPVEEQMRIVEKVEALMALCDELDSKSDNFLEALNKLRQTILQLAVEGKLGTQDNSDQPASELLKQIVIEKQRLVTEGKVKKSKTPKPIDESEKRFSIPNSWEWVRLQDVLDVRDGTHDSPKYVDEGMPLVTSKNLSPSGLNLSKVNYISEKDHIEISKRSKVDIGDVLFAMIGTIGNPVIIEEEPCFSIKNVALFKHYKTGLIYSRFLHSYLVFATENMKHNASGAVQNFVSLGYLRNYPMPLPPLEEQKRIVEKVEALISLCDELENKLSAAI